MTDFDGFPRTGLDLLRDLPNWDRDTYGDRKVEVHANLVDPAKAFVPAMVDALREEVSPGIDGAAKINGSISPLNNDLRFAPAGSPLYKDHLLLWFWEGKTKKGSPMLAIRLGADDVGFASGMGFDGQRLERWRKAVDGPAGDRIATLLASLDKKVDLDVAGNQLKRVPAPYDADHRHEGLLRYKALQARWPEALPASVGKASFVGWCAKRMARLAELHRTFVGEVA